MRKHSQAANYRSLSQNKKRQLNWPMMLLLAALGASIGVPTYANEIEKQQPSQKNTADNDVAVVIHKGHAYDPEQTNTLKQPVQQQIQTDPTLRWPKYHANLTDVLHFGLANHPTALRANAQLNAANYKLRATQGRLLPTLTASAAYGPERTDNSATRADGHNHIDLMREEKVLQIEQLLYDGGKVWNRIKRDKANLQARKQAAFGVRENVTLRIINAYLNILRFRAAFDVATRDVKIHRLNLKRTRIRVEGGAGRKSELALARTRLNEAKARYDLAQTQLEAANHLFIQEVGKAPPQSLAKARLNPRQLPQRLSGARTTAFKNSPSLASAEADVNATGHEIAALKSEYLPTISLDLQASRDNQLDGVKGQNNEDLALVRMSYNLYNGGSDRARVKEAIANRDEALQELAESRRDVEQRVSTAWTDMITTRARYRALQRNVKNATVVVENYKKEFDIGQRSLLNLLDAENERFRAENNLIDARFEYLLSQYRILEAMGVLSSTVLG